MTGKDKVVATGGTVSTLDGYTAHTFTSSDTFTVTSPGEIEVCIVGGGGGSGKWSGGEAGKCIHTNETVIAGSYPIQVGAAGDPGRDGSDSSAFLMTAKGGMAGRGPMLAAGPMGVAGSDGIVVIRYRS